MMIITLADIFLSYKVYFEMITHTLSHIHYLFLFEKSLEQTTVIWFEQQTFFNLSKKWISTLMTVFFV